eukprot:10231096-Alexandrium_andersonii.AAC.1
MHTVQASIKLPDPDDGSLATFGSIWLGCVAAMLHGARAVINRLTLGPTHPPHTHKQAHTHMHAHAVFLATDQSCHQQTYSGTHPSTPHPQAST